MIYEEIISISESQNWDVQYEFVSGPGFSLKMKDQWHPFSIKVREFEFIKNFVINNDLRLGYEVATAFGISATAAGLGFAETGGRLVTMDAYIEEQYGECGAYAHKGKEVYGTDSKGWRSMQNLIKYFALEDHVFPKIGWSPDDALEKINEEIDLSSNKLDYAFIDGLHTEGQVIKDTQVIEPYIDRNHFAIFYHDLFLDKKHYPTLHNYLKETFGVTPRLIPECAMPFGYDLGIVTNIL